LQSIKLESQELEPISCRQDESIWQAALGSLQLNLSSECYNTWLSKTTFVSLKNNRLTIGAPNAFVAEMLEQRLFGIVLNYVQKLTGSRLDLKVVVVGATDQASLSASLPTDQASLSASLPTENSFSHPRVSSKLFHKFTFSGFIVGPSNELAHAAAVAVASDPANKYNPLVIHSSVGLGKTHLLHAIGHSAKSLGLQATYVTTEEFTNQYISAIRTGTTEEFRFRYRHVDLLLIDDIQFLSGKEQTQEGFFHTFNELYMSGKQVVVASDRPVHELNILEKRIKSRLFGGLIVDLQPPSIETRTAILLSKLESLKRPGIISNDIVHVLANRETNNVRELEGSLNRIVAYAELVNEEITADIVSTVLPHVDSISTLANVPHKRVIHLTAKHFNVDSSDLLGRSRNSRVSNARHIAMYLMREESNMGFKEIGQTLGRRDHSTVINACRKISLSISCKGPLSRDLEILRNSLRSAH